MFRGFTGPDLRDLTCISDLSLEEIILISNLCSQGTIFLTTESVPSTHWSAGVYLNKKGSQLTTFKVPCFHIACMQIVHQHDSISDLLLVGKHIFKAQGLFVPLAIVSLLGVCLQRIADFVNK